jgi:hypothetical protein
MNLWNKIVLGTKFIFGGFESATDYLLGLLNDFIGKENVAGKIQKALEFVSTILKYMKKYEKYCPAIWASDYLKLIDVLQMFVNVLDDSKVTSDEIQVAIASVKDAIKEWMK